MLSPTIAPAAATTITHSIPQWSCASTAAVISAVSPGSGMPGRLDRDEQEEQDEPVVEEEIASRRITYRTSGPMR